MGYFKERGLPAAAAIGFRAWLATRPRVLLFGASEAGRRALSWLEAQGVAVEAFVDNDAGKHGQTFCGRTVLPPAALASYCRLPVLISSCHARDIALQLRAQGVETYHDFSFATDAPRWEGHFDPAPLRAAEERLAWLDAQLEDEASRQVLADIVRYRLTGDAAALPVSDFASYRHPVVKAQPGDGVVDGGAWRGDTLASFLEEMQGQGTVYAFEPDPDSFRILAQQAPPGVQPVAAGLWRESGELALAPAEASMETRLDSEGHCRVPVVALDAFAQKHKIDLIKMDIEGAEAAALEGAAELLRRDAPRLQICVYHRPEDLWLLAEAIRGYNPRYRFYLGHHSSNLVDTVLYAVAA